MYVLHIKHLSGIVTFVSSFLFLADIINITYVYMYVWMPNCVYKVTKNLANPVYGILIFQKRLW